MAISPAIRIAIVDAWHETATVTDLVARFRVSDWSIRKIWAGAQCVGALPAGPRRCEVVDPDGDDEAAEAPSDLQAASDRFLALLRRHHAEMARRDDHIAPEILAHERKLKEAADRRLALKQSETEQA